MKKKANQNRPPQDEISQHRLIHVWRQFRRNTGAMIGLAVVLLLVFVAVFADVIWDYKVDVIGMNIPDRMMAPCLKHPFGTDNYGRDMLARVGYGARYSLVIGFVAVVFGMLVGIPIGASAGYIGGRYDTIMMRFIDAFSIIPSILLSILLVTVLGANLVNLIIALAIGTIPIFARITRAAVLTVRYNEYIESIRATGASGFYIMMRYIIPNCFSTILVQATLRMGTTIISAAGLSYVGLGVALPTPEWGALLSASKQFIIQAPYLCFFPGLAIMITVMAINQVGDGLRDALDPKLKK